MNLYFLFCIMDTISFNKEKLLSAISVDEFNLHLPNPKTLIDNLLQNDDVETFAKYYNNLCDLISNRLSLSIRHTSKNIMKIFEYRPFPTKIIAFLMQANYIGVHLDKCLEKYDEGYTDEQRNYFLYIIDKMNSKENYRFNFYGDYKNLHKDKEIKKDDINIPEIKIVTETLLNFESLSSNQDILVEYIKWLIDFSSIMPKLINIVNYKSNSKDDVKDVFWHPNDYDYTKYEEIFPDKKYIINKLKSYSHLFNPWIVHDGGPGPYTEYDCKFCEELENKNHKIEFIYSMI